MLYFALLCMQKILHDGIDTLTETGGRIWKYWARICIGIHPERFEPASPIELTTSRMEAPQTRRACARSLDTFTQPFLHRVWPKIRGPERGSRSVFIVVVHAFSWRHVRGGVGRSLIRTFNGLKSGEPPLHEQCQYTCKTEAKADLL